MQVQVRQLKQESQPAWWLLPHLGRALDKALEVSLRTREMNISSCWGSIRQICTPQDVRTDV